MSHASYKQFCPVAMAAEVLCTRWTLLLIREFVAGSTRFSDLRRGVPKMSPTLLSQRLKEMEADGIIERKLLHARNGTFEYQLTESGRELGAVVEMFGCWGQKWIKSKPSLQNLDIKFLMWDMRRNLNSTPLPKRRTVIQFVFPELPTAQRRWWLVVEPKGDVGLCWQDPGFEIDLYVTTDLRTMTAVWMGLTTVAKQRDMIQLSGPRTIINSMQTWLGLSPFAKVEKLVS
jgi:DNA-binding HxlR family transcriptional regulator